MTVYDARWWHVARPRWWQVVLVALATILVVLLAGALVLVGCGYTVAHADAGPGDTGQEVVEVQYLLSSYRYVLVVDGIYGAQTTKAVRHFQRANGLKPDGVAGPITMAALAGAPAVRGGVPDFGGDLCAQMSWYRQQAGLPPEFDQIGFRESRCQNDAPPTLAAAACCRGWWAIAKTNIRAPGYAAGAKACGITSEADYYGTSPEQMRASACFAFVIYEYHRINGPYGTWAWRT